MNIKRVSTIKNFDFTPTRSKLLTDLFLVNYELLGAIRWVSIETLWKKVDCSNDPECNISL